MTEVEATIDVCKLARDVRRSNYNNVNMVLHPTACAMVEQESDMSMWRFVRYNVPEILKSITRKQK